MKMRKVTLGLANSLDNYIARVDGGYDWLQWNDEVARISAKFMNATHLGLNYTRCFTACPNLPH